MMVTASRVSTIERVPAMMIALLEQAGDLPTMPDAYAVQEGGRGFRRPRIEDGAALTWVLAWDGPRTDGFAFRKPSGILGYEDRYDFHIASDVRAVCYLAGQRRAVVDLLRSVQRESRAANRRLVGAIDLHNQPLAHVLERLGATATRTIFEDRGL
jgi:hypothetical protein